MDCASYSYSSPILQEIAPKTYVPENYIFYCPYKYLI